MKTYSCLPLIFQRIGNGTIQHEFIGTRPKWEYLADGVLSRSNRGPHAFPQLKDF